MMRRRVAVLLGIVVALALTGCTVMYSEPPAGTPTPVPPPAPPPPPPTPPYSPVDVSAFYAALDPYGDWIRMEPYGWVWAPGAVDPFWRPYTVGRWVWSDYGWTWVGEEDWGWATYHYGRWARVPRYGWVWVPGNVWAPAWVAWRHGQGSVGWAPLPPEIRFSVGIGLDLGGVNIDVVIRPDWWCFVDEVRLVEPHVARYAVPVGRNATLIHVTQNVTNVTIVNQRVVVRGVPVEAVERASRRAVPQYRVGDLDDEHGGGPRVRVEERQVRFYRPEVREDRGNAAPPRTANPAPGGSPLDKAQERLFDKAWDKDWKRLEKIHVEEERKATPPPPNADPRTARRDERAAAADHAWDESKVFEERTKRQAARGAVSPAQRGKAKAAPPAGKPQEPKPGDEKPEKK